MNPNFIPLAIAAAVAAAFAVPRAHRRLQLSRAKHRSLAGHSRMAKRVASLIPGFTYGPDRFFAVDGAPADVVARRRAAFDALSSTFTARYASTVAMTRQARDGLSDLQFTSRYRVPFPFSSVVRERLAVGSFLKSADGVQVEDLDGNRFYDLTGSYGVNVLGVDAYKECIDEAVAMARPLGPVLGSYHPCVLDNVERLKAISGLDEVSFHMSGTEAVMQAVRLARYHTGKRRLVRFCGAYHGWWEDVQPGPGNPLPPRDTLTLRDLHERSLAVLATRDDIACVLVNPLQALHPNRNAPGDSSLVVQRQGTAFDREAYATWLAHLRDVCEQRGIVLIFDEVFVGFRLAPGGAQEYFGVRADLVTYGKTLGGGLPVGVVCGRQELMKRYRDDRPADVCFARGTFNSHPYVMAAMNAFLRRLDRPETRRLYDGLDERWNARAARLNDALATAGVPVRVANLSTIWTVSFEGPSRYHWMLQFYLREQGLALSWVGTGRLIFSLDYDEAQFDAVLKAFVAGATKMSDDGWWWRDPASTPWRVGRSFLADVLRERFGLRGMVGVDVPHRVDPLAS
jgi:glutamate-1-semialdehyde 2,1-aminomutase